MAIASQMPRASDVNQRIRIDHARCRYAWFTFFFTAKPRMVKKSHSPPLEDCPSKLLKQLRFFRAIWNDEAQTRLHLGNLDTQWFGQDGCDLAPCRLSSSPILGVKALSHEITAHQQHNRLVSGKTERWQEIPFDQVITFPRCSNQRHTAFVQRHQVAVNGAFADLERLGQVFSPLASFGLQFQDNR